MNIDEVFKKLKPIMGKRIDGIWREYLVADPTTKKMIEDSLRLTLARELDHSFEGREILLEPPPKDLAMGDYPLGMVHYGRRPFHLIGLREDEFIQHLGIFGRSGSGKTNIAYLIILNLLRKNKPFLIFDWKRNYRDLLPQVKEKDVFIYTVGRKVSPFYFNPLIPPKGTPATVWLKKLIDIMCHAYFLGEGVAYLMQKAIDTVYQKYKVYDGEPAKWPTLEDVKTWLEDQRVKAKEALWMQSALRAVGVLCFGEVGRVLNSQKPIDFKDLLKKNVILELDALTSSDKTFLIEALLIWIHHYRLAQQEKEQFKHAIIIYETTNLIESTAYSMLVMSKMWGIYKAKHIHDHHIRN